MATTAAEKQEARSEVVGVSVTPSEKKAVRSMAYAKGMSESEVLRRYRMDEVLEFFAGLRSSVGDEQGAQA